MITYVSVKGESDIPQAAPGQLDPLELIESYRFRTINANTRIFGITGFPLKATASPFFFNTVFRRENINAVYLPFPSDSIESFLALAEDLNLSGASVTIPHKETLVPFLAKKSEKVQATGACNTIVRNEHNGWDGYNTDAEGFSSSLLNFIGSNDLKGKKITIIGAGGAARSVASEVFSLHGDALILNRSSERARDLAEPYNFRWGGLDSPGISLIYDHSDIIIQTTAVGMEPDIEGDPIKPYKFSGQETVMDIIYKPAQTALLRRAASAGCRVLSGLDMFIAQAQRQYRLFMGKEFPAQLMREISL
jgi:3-dehydroquinate dehydratase/shikimate dehydrogenase